MTERCVFSGIDFQQSSVPMNRGGNGECFAIPGAQMNECCFKSAERLILLGNKEDVLEAAEKLKGRVLSQRSRLRGLSGALYEHS